MEKVYTKNAPDAIGPYSQAVKVNGLVLHQVRLQLTLQQAMLRLQQLRLRQNRFAQTLKMFLRHQAVHLKKLLRQFVS